MHLAKKAYDLPPATFDEKSLANSVAKLYPDQQPEYDHAVPAYNVQLAHLASAYFKMTSQFSATKALQSVIPVFFARLAIPTYFSGSKNFYKETKLGLEHVLVLLATKPEAVKHSMLLRLCRQLAKCSAGIYTPIQSLSFELREQNSVPELLAKHRKVALDKMAEDYVQGPLTQKMLGEYKTPQGAKARVEDLSIAVYATIYQLASRCNLGVPLTKKFSEMKNFQSTITGLAALTPEAFLAGFQKNCTAESSIAFLLVYYKDQFDHFAKMDNIQGEQLNINFKKLVKPFVDNNVFGLYDALVCDEKSYKTTLNPLFLEKLETHINQLLVKTDFLSDEKYTPTISLEVEQSDEVRVRDAQANLTQMMQAAPFMVVSMRMVRAEMALRHSIWIVVYGALFLSAVAALFFEIYMIFDSLYNAFEKPHKLLYLLTGISGRYRGMLSGAAIYGLRGLRDNVQGLAENTTSLVIPVLNGVVQAIQLTFAVKLVLECLDGVELPATTTLMVSIFAVMLPGNMMSRQGISFLGLFPPFEPRRAAAPAAAPAEAVAGDALEDGQDNALVALNAV